MNHPAPIHSVLLRSVPRPPQVQLEDRLPAHLGLKQLAKGSRRYVCRSGINVGLAQATT